MGKKNEQHITASEHLQSEIPSLWHTYKSKLKSIKPEILLLGIFILALVIRFIYLYQMRITPLFNGLALDTEKYDLFALHILHGNFTYKDLVYLNPLYPLFLAFIYLICGQSHLAVVCVQGIVDSISCIFIYYIGATVFNKKIGMIAACIYALYGIAIFYTGMLLAPTIILFFILLFIISLLIAEKKRNRLLFFASGILFGIAVLGRPNSILFLMLLPIWFFALRRREGMKKAAIYGFLLLVLGYTVVTSAVIVRNYAIEKSFLPFSLQNGIAFYIGNNPESQGICVAPYGISNEPVEIVKSSIRYAEKETGKTLMPTQASRYWYNRGLQFFRNNPAQAFLLYIRKCILFWRHEEISLNVNFPLSKTFAPIFRLPFFTFGSIAPFALFGIIICLKWRSYKSDLLLLFIFSYMVSVIVFFVAAQFRLPVIPFLIICAACGLDRCFEIIRMKDIRRIIFVTVLLAVLYCGININSEYVKDTSEFHYAHLGKVYRQMGQLDMAEESLQKALSIKPDYAVAHNNLGIVYHEKGLSEDAIEKYKEALRLNPLFAQVHNNLGNIYLEKGLLDDAIHEYKKTIEVRPDYEIAHNNLGIAYAKKGAIDNAIVAFEETLALNSLNVEALTKCGLLYLGKRRVRDAIRVYKQAMSLRPYSSEIHYNLASAYNFQGNHMLAQIHFNMARKLEYASQMKK